MFKTWLAELLDNFWQATGVRMANKILSRDNHLDDLIEKMNWAEDVTGLKEVILSEGIFPNEARKILALRYLLRVCEEREGLLFYFEEPAVRRLTPHYNTDDRVAIDCRIMANLESKLEQLPMTKLSSICDALNRSVYLLSTENRENVIGRVFCILHERTTSESADVPGSLSDTQWHPVIISALHFREHFVYAVAFTTLLLDAAQETDRILESEGTLTFDFDALFQKHESLRKACAPAISRSRYLTRTMRSKDECSS
ncbi:hypothetical protein COB55_04185 [Candidatus Wolfebacteria bacterium]|nr:MAG: hypothetical protein COB55_04185 [Candidatus Wolfebacteria bacterium]